MTRFPNPGSWYRFTPADWSFIAGALAASERDKEGMAALQDDPDSVRSIVDHPKLFQALLSDKAAALVSPELFFFVVVRHTLKRIGVEELEVADYIAVVCADFGCRSTVRRDPPGTHPESLYSIDYLEAIENAGRREKFFLHVQCANQFLVLTSLYPDYLRRRAERRGAPDVDYYEKVVVSQLAAARSHVLAEEFALETVFERLSDSFPPVRRAMNHTVREYLHLGA